MAMSSSHLAGQLRPYLAGLSFHLRAVRAGRPFDSLLSQQLIRHPRGFDHPCRGLSRRSLGERGWLRRFTPATDRADRQSL